MEELDKEESRDIYAQTESFPQAELDEELVQEEPKEDIYKEKENKQPPKKPGRSGGYWF